jgi:sigma-B regulation protein RsbU (phosphoserine phosphatase)
MAMLELLIERPGRPPASRTFEGGALVVGRTDKADIHVDDASVSRRHARLFSEGNDWFVEDLGSRNGTSLNGAAISAPSRLHPGDTISVGDTTLRVGPCEPLRAPSLRVHPETTIADGAVFSVLRPASELAQVETGAASRLQLLLDVHRVLAGPVSSEDLLRIILDRVFAVLKPEQAAIFLRGPDRELYKAAERRAPRSSGSTLISRRLEEEVANKGAAALVLDAQADERFASAQSVLVSGVRSILAAPLADAEGCLGMIALYSSIQVRRFCEEDLELLVSLASAAALRIRNISLAEQAAERRALERELTLAREVQTWMLSRLPERPEIDVAARLAPARSVGGDFYDFVIEGDTLWFIVADVAGKGMGAALMMAVAKTLFRGAVSTGLQLSEAMTRVNREIARDNDRAVFVTAFAGCMDLKTGRTTVINAGHNLPYRVLHDGQVVLVKARNSMALGVTQDTSFVVEQLGLDPGDALLLYTDGVCDATDASGAAFGTAGLERRLVELAPLGDACTVVDSVFEAVTAFAGSAPQEDDITVAVVRYTGSG